MYSVLTALFLFAPADQPASVAMVLRVKGEVTLARAGEKPARVWSMDLLRPGDKLNVPKDAEVRLIVLDDGHKETLAADKTATMTKTGCTPAGAVARKEASKLGKEALENMRDDIASGRLGGTLCRGPKLGETLPVLSPLPTATVLTARPTLTWPKVDDATSYVVMLSTGNDLKAQRRVFTLETKEPRLPFPPKRAALQPVLHRWSVAAKFKGGDEKTIVSREQGEFTVATEDQIKQLDAVKPLATSDDPTDKLLAASAYESLGVLDEAFRLYRQLAEKPLADDARLHEIVARYYAAGGQPKLAEAARKKGTQLLHSGGRR